MPDQHSTLVFSGLALIIALAIYRNVIAAHFCVLVIRNGSIQRRSVAFETLSSLGADSCGPLIILLGAQEENLRIRASLILAKNGALAVPALTKAIGACQPVARAQALLILGRYLKRHAARAIPEVSKALSDEDRLVRIQAAGTLWNLDPSRTDALPPLIEALRNGNPQHRLISLNVLEELGVAAEPAIPLLIEALKDEEPEIRQQAARALGSMGPRASAALPDLTRATQDERTSDFAREAIDKIRRGEPEISRSTQKFGPASSKSE